MRKFWNKKNNCVTALKSGREQHQLRSQTIKNEKLISGLKTLRGQISKRKKESVKLLKAKDTLLKEKINLRT